MLNIIDLSIAYLIRNRMSFLAFRRSDHSGVISSARLIVMNPSLLVIVSSEPLTLSATSVDPRRSTHSVNSMIAASSAAWFSVEA